MRQLSLLPLLGICFYLACQPANRKPETQAASDAVPATLEDRLSGLWSRDSSGRLTNSGFLLSGDGTCMKIGSPGEGTWMVKDSLSVAIHWNDDPDTLSIGFKRLGTSDAEFEYGDSTSLYRKVPFGKSDQSEVISGLSGNINSRRPGRTYPLQVPSTKLIELRMQSDDPDIGFQVFEKDQPRSGAFERDWKCIIVDPAGFRLEIGHRVPSRLDTNGTDFDLKVMGF